MSVIGGGNLYPNWLGSASLTIPNNQVVVNGAVVNVVPTVDLTNRTISSVAPNTKTILYQYPAVAAGTYLINAEFQVQNTGGGQTAYAQGDSVSFTVQGLNDPSPDYAQATCRPYWFGITDGGNNNGTTGVVRLTPSGITVISANNTPLVVYVKYNTGSAGTQTMTFASVTLSWQKIA